MIQRETMLSMQWLCTLTVLYFGVLNIYLSSEQDIETSKVLML